VVALQRRRGLRADTRCLLPEPRAAKLVVLGAIVFVVAVCGSPRAWAGTTKPTPRTCGATSRSRHLHPRPTCRSRSFCRPPRRLQDRGTGARLLLVAVILPWIGAYASTVLRHPDGAPHQPWARRPGRASPVLCWPPSGVLVSLFHASTSPWWSPGLIFGAVMVFTGHHRRPHRISHQARSRDQGHQHPCCLCMRVPGPPRLDPAQRRGGLMLFVIFS
jgi:hypothetical protein